MKDKTGISRKIFLISRSVWVRKIIAFKLIYRILYLTGILMLFGGWGFYAHQQINRLSVFILPEVMIGFYKKNLDFISEAAVNPDKRRYVMEEEGPRHYIDIDHYGDSAVYKMPRYWQDAVTQYSEDTLLSFGVVPWHIVRVYYQLRDAFMIRDPEAILKLSSELGHYIADAHVPLHTTENYNGQLTGQNGIHALWESRLPELFAADYDFMVGRAVYIRDIQWEAWRAVTSAHEAVDSVLRFEKILHQKMQEKKFGFETRGKQTQRVVSVEYSHAYHALLNGMVERQMRASVKMIGNCWFSAWVDAGQPDLDTLVHYKPDKATLERRKAEMELFKQQRLKSRESH
jgi:hypothetical protein